MNGPTPLITVRLSAIRYAARDTHLYELRDPSGQPLPDATAGSHIDLHLPNGLVRQYSLVESGQDLRRYLIGVKRDANSRGGSRYLHEQVRVGSLIEISTPRNNFSLAETREASVLVAGGIGITPIWAMVGALERQGRAWQLHYACRSREDAAFVDQAEAFGDKVRVHFDDECGSVLDVAAIVHGAPGGAHLYCCGPVPMLAAFEAAGAARSPNTLHVEYFTSNQEAATCGGFVLALSRSGREFNVAPGQTVLAVLRDAGLQVASSCEQGVCGACETPVLEGVVDHRDAILTPEERLANRTMMVCCSGCKSARLVLDI